MPLPLIPLIAAGAALGSQGINAASQAAVNRKSREWNEKMYWTQRKNNLEDWQMQADYNSPEAQMERLKAAGLNPHLVYGSGADATMNAPVKSADSGSWNPKAPEFDMQSVLGSYLSAQQSQLAIDNLKKQGALLDAEKLLKDWNVQEIIARIPKHNVDTKLGNWQLQFKELSTDTMLRQLQANLQKTQAEAQFVVDQNWRHDEMQKVNIRKIGEEILTMRKQRAKTDAEIRHIDQQIENLKSAKSTVDIENSLREIGIQPGDKPLWRLILGNVVPREFKRGSALESGVGGAVGGFKRKF